MNQQTSIASVFQAACVGLLTIGLHSAIALELTPINQSLVGSSEIVAFDKTNDRVFAPSAAPIGIAYAPVSAAGLVGTATTVAFANPFTNPSYSPVIQDVTSVAVHPTQDWGVASLVPTLNGPGTTLAEEWTPGRLVVFNTSDGSTITTIEVGYHPDSVTFTPDGTKILVANEAENNNVTGTDAPGSITVVDVSTITSSANFIANLGAVTTTDFSGTSASLRTGIRDQGPNVGSTSNFGAGAVMNTSSTVCAPARLEPEYIVATNTTAYVSLQENNAIGVFDLSSNTWTQIFNLGVIAQTIDASDRDNAAGTGAAILVDDEVYGMPMPDTLGLFTSGGVDYLVTANEGDFLSTDNDRARIADSVFNGGANQRTIDPTYVTTLNTRYPSPAYASGYETNSALGRLRVSTRDGDTDGDGDIDQFRMPGTRSFSIWNASTGVRVFDSGVNMPSTFEEYIAANDAANFNIDQATPTVDDRSPNKGPEPEGLTVATIGTDTYVFVALERTNHVFVYKIDTTTPGGFQASDVTLDSAVKGGTNYGPEGMVLVPAVDSPTGQNLLLVGSEVSTTIASYDFAPGTYASTTPQFFFGGTFDTTLGVDYTVKASTNPEGPFFRVVDTFTGDGNPYTFIDTTEASTRQFYRVIEE
jgi:hypothetical protein